MNKYTLKILIFFLTAFILYPGIAAAQPEVFSEAAVLMDMDNGQLLYQKNADIKMYPASTTKILTALVVLKNGNLEDSVTVSRDAAMIGGSRVGLQEGEVVKEEDLLYMLLLSSANDAAVALAEHVGGSIGHFAEMMNAEARSLGASNSNFTNPHGLPDPNHYTTAGDLAIITREAMKNPIFRKIVGTYHYKVERTLPTPVKGIPQVDFVNHNKLLHSDSMFYDKDATGIKTGYTDEARQCLVASATKNGREMLAVVLKSENEEMYRDSTALLNYGFNEFKPVVLAEAGAEECKASIKKGVEGDVAALASRRFYYDVPVSSNYNIGKKINIDGSVIAPIVKGQKIGSVNFIYEGKAIGSVDLLSDRDVYKKTIFRWWYGLIFLGALYMAIRTRAYSRRRRYIMRKKRWN